MKILLANLPAYYDAHPNRHFIASGSRWSFSFDAPKNRRHPHYQPYPFSLGFAAAILRDAGYEVDGFDGCALNMDEAEWLRRVEASHPDTLIVEVPTVVFPLAMVLLRRVRGVSKVLVTGPHVTALPGSAGDFATIPGEWETFAVGQLAFHDYPFPDRQFFPNELYSNFEFHRPSAQLLTSRGCFAQCIFCVERHVYGWGLGLRSMSATRVVDEMASVQALGARQVWFDDMSITAKPGHIQGICRELLERGLDLPWTTMCDMNASEATVKQMAEAGCIGVAFGVETIDEGVLRGIGKPFVSKEKALRFTALLRDLGIHSVGTFALGLPGQSATTIRQDIAFGLHELGADSVQFSIATPFPGTPFYRLCDAKGWLVTKDWTRYDGARWSVVDYPELKHSEIELLHQYAMEQRREQGMGFRK